jgi:hypothetical protein
MGCCALNGGQLISLKLNKNDDFHLVRWSDRNGRLVSSSLPLSWEPRPPVIVADYGLVPTVIFTTSNDEIVVVRLDDDFSAHICGNDAGRIATLAVSSNRALLVSASKAGTEPFRVTVRDGV